MRSYSCLIYLYMIFLTLSSNFLITVFTKDFQCYSQHFKLIENFKLIESSPYQLKKFESSENLVLQNILSSITPFVQVLCQSSNDIILYYNPIFNSSYLKLLVWMPNYFRHLSRHTVLCIFHFSIFLIKCILLVMCLACMVSLTLLDIHTSDLISNIMIGACYGTKYGSLFISSVLSILKCYRAITALRDAL